ncbi:MAG: hypothetical protein WCL16_13835, partial [bacterium]
MIKANAWACILVSCGLLLGLLRPTGVLAVELLLPIPEATKIDVDNLSLAVRASLACAGRYLMQNIETNNMG